MFSIHLHCRWSYCTHVIVSFNLLSAHQTPCMKIPCQNGATCSPIYSHDEYQCVCLPGFTGQHCETGRYWKYLIQCVLHESQLWVFHIPSVRPSSNVSLSCWQLSYTLTVFKFRVELEFCGIVRSRRRPTLDYAVKNALKRLNNTKDKNSG